MFMNIRRLGQSLVAVCLLAMATWALALPTPKDIEAAVAAGQYSQAEALLREVIHDKPQSAKAHYELGQVLAREARYAEAEHALKQAQTLDPSLKFAASAEKFNQTMDKVHALASTATLSSPPAAQSTPAVVAAPVSTPNPSSGLTYVWLGIGALVVLALVLRRRAASQPDAPVYAPAPAPVAPRGFGAQFTPNAAATYPQPGYGPGYGAPSSGGSTVTGAVVGGLAGVAAGYALSKALEGDHSAPAPHATPADNRGYVPFDTPAQPDLGSFDAGSGAGWDDAGAASDSSDDSW